MKWRAAVDRAPAPLRLTHAQYVLLASLCGMERDGQRPTRRARDPADTRAVRLALTGRGQQVVQPAIAEVATLLGRLMTPLGGRGLRAGPGGAGGFRHRSLSRYGMMAAAGERRHRYPGAHEADRHDNG